MRRDRYQMIADYMFEPPEKTQALTAEDKRMLMILTDCYNQQISNPNMMTTVRMRDYLRNHYGVSNSEAYQIINVVRVALGDVSEARIKWVKYRIDCLAIEAYNAAKAGDTKLTDALCKIGTMLSRAYRTDLEQGDPIDIDKLTVESINFTIDPSAINLNISPTEAKEIMRLKKKYHIEEDTPFVEIVEENKEAQDGCVS